MKARVSIGLPVYNGENYLAQALDSLLAQTFEDFEIIISDNASTDHTEEIGRDYAAKDPRVRYSRNEQNIGAGPNFNRAFELATGAYFKWAAHDDLCAPEFLQRCVEVLDGDPSVVLCYSKIEIIDGQGESLPRPYDVKLRTDSPRPAVRYREIVRGATGHLCFEVFGLIRSASLAKTGLMGNFPHGDGVLLAQLALRGRFVEVPEALFFPRRHSEQSMSTMADRYMWVAWFDPSRKGKIVLPYWRMHWEYFKAVVRAVRPGMEQLRCYAHLARATVTVRRRLLRELGAAVSQLARRPREHPTACDETGEQGCT